MTPDYTRTLARVEFTATHHPVEDSFLRGGDVNWTWAVGMPYQVLANAHAVGAMPASPNATKRRNEHGGAQGNFEHGLGYFASLQSFLTYSLGWTRHDLGLRWWFENGRPVIDSRFALIRAVWDADGMLLRYLAWCVERATSTQGLSWTGEPLHLWAETINRAPAALTAAWRQRLAEHETAAKSGDLSASPWGMHLERGDHIGAPSGWDWAGYAGSVVAPRDLDGAARLVATDEASRRATYLSDFVGGWYEGLATLGSQLSSQSGERSWRIGVYVRPIGYLGEYRRSRSTGLWFAGRHRYHSVGN